MAQGANRGAFHAAEVLAGATMRGLFEAGDLLVLVDGDQLLAYDPATSSSMPLDTITAGGPVAAAHLNGSLYLNTLNESLRFDGKALTPWAVPPCPAGDALPSATA